MLSQQFELSCIYLLVYNKINPEIYNVVVLLFLWCSWEWYESLTWSSPTILRWWKLKRKRSFKNFTTTTMHYQWTVKNTGHYLQFLLSPYDGVPYIEEQHSSFSSWHPGLMHNSWLWTEPYSNHGIVLLYNPCVSDNYVFRVNAIFCVQAIIVILQYGHTNAALVRRVYKYVLNNHLIMVLVRILPHNPLIALQKSKSSNLDHSKSACRSMHTP